VVGQIQILATYCRLSSEKIPYRNKSHTTWKLKAEASADGLLYKRTNDYVLYIFYLFLTFAFSLLEEPEEKSTGIDRH
jgi:hypothetical protein